MDNDKPANDLPDFAKQRLEVVAAEPDVIAEVVENESMKVWDIPLDLIDFNPNNPNEQDEETFNVLVEEMDETHEGSPGFLEPVHVVRLKNGRFEMVGGEHRARGRRAAGKKTVPGFIMDGVLWDTAEFREFMLLRLNQLRGKLNPEKFLKLYKKYEEQYGNERLKRLFAFVDKDYWEQLTGGTKQALRDMGVSAEMLQDFDNRTKEIKTVDDLAAILNSLFQKYGNDLRFDFLVFVFGGKNHLMIRMDAAMAKQMETVKVFCRDNQVNINDVMKPVVKKFEEFVSDPTTLEKLRADAAKETENEEKVRKTRRVQQG